MNTARPARTARNPGPRSLLTVPRVRRGHFIVLALLNGLATQAGDISTNQVLTPIVTPDVGASLLRVVGGLIFVLALFFAGVWLSRNWQRFAARSGVAPRLSVLESKMIGNRQVLYVVGYRNQRMLLGSSPSGLTLISHLPEDDASTSAPAAAFAQNLRDALAKPS